MKTRETARDTYRLGKKTSKRADNKAEHEFFARSASGLEAVLAGELKNLKVRRVRPLTGGVAFFGSFEDAYRVCLWSRTASRVLYILARFNASDSDALYKGVQSIDWTEHIGPTATISVHAHGTNEQLRNTQFSAVRIKDAICDQLLKKRGMRPNVQQYRPDVLVDMSLRGNKATIALDFSGEPLHRRGYREEGKQSEAPLKENLAAGIVLASGWNDVAKRGGAFVDPLCGSGTLVIEAALIAANKAPGLLRDYWGFTGWHGFDGEVWEELLAEAREHASSLPQPLPQLLHGSDHDKACIALARKNAERAGVSELINFTVRDVSELGQILKADNACLSQPANTEDTGLQRHESLHGDGQGADQPRDSEPAIKTGKTTGKSQDRNSAAANTSGLLVTNPPYGQRLLTSSELPELYEALAKGIESLDDTWQVAVITPDESIDGALGLAPFETLPLYNGKIETKLRRYKAGSSERITLDVVSLQGKEHRLALTERNSEQFAARLRKTSKERKKWARKNNISCYRIYDADLPDYVVSVDVYEGAGASEGERYVLVSEYKAPAEIDTGKAARRLSDVCTITTSLLDIEPDCLLVKTRKRDKGGGQYKDAKGDSHLVYTQESGYLLELDMGGYLDTGIFLDHRLTRQMLGELAEGKSFLNLFAYTGVATVHAAGGGALSTKSVDLSSTYLAWAERNMKLNGFAGNKHSYVRADILDWMEEEQKRGNRYDVIFVDPPTFSNSKSMKDASWQVQRDHVILLAGVKELLAEGGTLVFSCNLRSFKLDVAGLKEKGLTLTNITTDTIPHDFERNPKVHQCFILA